MPDTPAEKKLYAALVKEYGAKKGDHVYHAMQNKGKHKGGAPKVMLKKSDGGKTQ